MAWLSAPLTMPADAGADRSGGTRLQMPNVQRPLQSGGEGWAFVADATLTYLGTPYTLSGGVSALCDEGGTALATSAHYYIVYVLASAPTILRACWQEHWAAAYSASDCIGLAYVTEHYSLYLHVLVTRGCTQANPTPTLLTPKTNGIAFPMLDGTPLANADLRHLRGLAYDGTTGTLILSVGRGFQAQTVFVSANNDRIFYCGADGILHDTGLCNATSAYDGVAGTVQTTYWAPQGWFPSAGPFHFTIAAPYQSAMCCRGGKLYTIQYNQFSTLSKTGRVDHYGLGLGLIRSFDLTTHVETLHAAVAYAQDTGIIAEEYLSQAFNFLSLTVDSAGNFYTGFVPALETETTPPSTWSIYSGILRIPNPGAGVAIASSIIGDLSFPPLNPPDAAWAGGIGVNQMVDAAYAEGLARTSAALGLGTVASASSNGANAVLCADAHDNLLFAASQVQLGSTVLPYQYIRRIDAASGTLSTIIGNFHGRDVTTALTTFAGLPAYAGDTAAGHDGNASNSLSATWGGLITPLASDGGISPPQMTNARFASFFTVDHTTNILYYLDTALAAIRSIKLDDGNLLCTLTGGPSWLTTADHGNGLALGPAQGMRGYPMHLAIDESTGNLYYTLAAVVGGVTVYDLYRARFY